MSATAPQPGPPLAKMLARRLLVIAAGVLVVNSVAVGLYYGSDRRVIDAELANDRFEAIEEALEGVTLPAASPARALYERHPEAYAFALVDRGGAVLDAMNLGLIPPGATDIFADDWITRMERPEAAMVVAGHEFAERDDGLRMVFVLKDDPARLRWLAFLGEFNEHVWLPILPLVLVLIGANTFLIRRGLAPIAAAAAWARGLSPGATTPPPTARLPAEIADLVEATQRSVERLAQALEAEKRRGGEAAHALRTPVAVLVARVDALPPGATKERLRADLSALSRTVQQVLASSRAEALDQRQTIDLRQPAESVIAGLVPFAFERGVELALDLPDAPAMALADPEGVEVALTNLIENAVFHGGAGSVQIAVGPGPVVTVRDHGPGLPENGEARLFDPFWRGPAAVPGGAGLGLAIVERVQRAQGGKVTAENAPAGGAAFVLSWKSPDF